MFYFSCIFSTSNLYYFFCWKHYTSVNIFSTQKFYKRQIEGFIKMYCWLLVFNFKLRFIYLFLILLQLFRVLVSKRKCISWDKVDKKESQIKKGKLYNFNINNFIPVFSLLWTALIKEFVSLGYGQSLPGRSRTVKEKIRWKLENVQYFKLMHSTKVLIWFQGNDYYF